MIVYELFSAILCKIAKKILFVYGLPILFLMYFETVDVTK